MKWVVVLLSAALIVALPLLFHREGGLVPSSGGAAELVVVTPHNEAIRDEFGAAFSAWHERRFGEPVRLDWRVIGGTTEIMRYLESEYQASAKVCCREAAARGESLSREEAMALDDPSKVTCRMDVFFGGGVFDHEKAERLGLTVSAWPDGEEPSGLFRDASGRESIPRTLNGEVWRGKAFYGNVLSLFGICYNKDRLRDLGIERPPASWRDLADPQYFGAVGLSDPTKSGSVAKAFDLILQTQCARAVNAAGITREQVAAYEAELARAKSDRVQGGAVPEAYYRAVADGWLDGVRLIQRIGANALYFTSSAGKVPVDVGTGAVAAGLAIDFFGRMQSEQSTLPDGREVMAYVTPLGESGVTADPVSLLRGAPHRKLGERFLEFVLSREGQKLWCFKPGTPGGPLRKSLRRLPIRREFYRSGDSAADTFCESVRMYYADPLDCPEADAYHLGEAFLNAPRWTGRHFSIQRDLIRAMCMDSGDELKRAWRKILQTGGPEKNPDAMRLLQAMPADPVPLTWESAVREHAGVPRLERLARWTAFFRRQYNLAYEAAGR